MLRAAPARSQDNPVELRLEAGYDGYFRPNLWMPLLINVNNSGPELTGELRVTSNTTAGLATNAYSVDIDLATQASKQVALNIKLLDFSTSVQVELVTSAGIIATAQRPVKLIPPADILYVVITESPRGVIDLQPASSGQGRVYQGNWRVANLPRTAAGLSGLDGMLLTDVDSGNLSAEQRQAIGDWVLSGGHLVVTGGPNWEKTQAGVTNLLPLQPRSSTTLVSIPSVGVFTGMPDAPLTATSPIVVAQGELVAGAQVLAQDGGLPILTRHSVGEGTADYLAVDPGTEPILSWADRSRFWLSLLTTGKPRPSWSFGVYQEDQASVSADFVKGLNLPDVLQLLGFLGIYIVLIGPVNYAVLRLLKRPELAWFTIPLIVVGTSAYAYATGFSLRGTTATVNRLALVQVWAGSDRAEVDGVVGVLAPRRSSYTVTVRNAMSLQTLNNSAAAINPALTSNLTIHEGSNYEARNVPVDAGTTAAFLVEGYTQAVPIEGEATLELGAGNDQPRFKVKLKNTSGLTLTDAVVMVMGGHEPLGMFVAGSEREVTVDLTPQPASRSAFNNVPPVLNFFAGSYNYSYDNYRERTIQELLGPSYYNQYGRGLGNSLDDQENFRRQAFLRSIALDNDPGGGRGMNVYVAGWSSTSPMDVDLNGVGFVTEDTTLWVHSLPVRIAGVGTTGEVEVPAAFTTWTLDDDSKMRDVAPYFLSLRYDDNAIFRFAPLNEFRGMQVDRLRVTVRVNDASVLINGKLSLWNLNTKGWDEVPLRGRLSAIIPNAAQYVTGQNAVRMRVETADNGQGFVFYDAIEVSMFGKMQ
jgi:hypothetical protein